MSSAHSTPVERTTFTYLDQFGVEITAYSWRGDAAGINDTDVIAGALTKGNVQGVIQIAHGIGEHALRYDAFARALVANGFIVYADDHRGHGATGMRQHNGDRALLGRLGPGGLRATEAAIAQLADIIHRQHPGVPVALFGHSWGSLMAQRLLNEQPRLWQAVVLSGSAFRTPRYMESGALNTKWAGEGASGFEWLSRDAAVAKAFIADPLCFEANILKLFGVRDGMRLFGKPAAGLAADVPVLIVAGSDDPLSRGDGLQRLAEAYRARGVRDVTLRRYEGARHEILNETNSDEVFADVITWLTDRLEE